MEKLSKLGLVALALFLQNCSKAPVSVDDENTASTEKTTINAACYSNPVINSDSGDPYCLRYNGKYYLYRPESEVTSKIIYNTSTDLINWTANAELSYSPGQNVWAPEVHLIEGTLYLFHAVPRGANGGRDLWVCKMASPTSTGNNQPVVIVGANNDEKNIDPSVFKEGSNYYLLWKNVQEQVGTNSRIVIRKLNPNNPTQFASGSTQTFILPAGGDLPDNKEHPCLVRQDYDGGTKSRYFLFFNIGLGDREDYKVNYATSSSLLGPYTHKGTMMEKNPARNIYAVGGHSVVMDGDSKRWMVYRAKPNTVISWDGRRPYIDRLILNAENNTASCEPTRTQSAYCPVPLP